jgi:hypothetical protein
MGNLGEGKVLTSRRSILMLDTSTVNAVADDRDTAAMIAGLQVGYFVRFPFTAVSEIIATRSGTRRGDLLRVCRKLLRAAGDCVEPHHEIIKIMVGRFETGLRLGLADVYIRMSEAENEILSALNFDDDLATQEREESRTNDRRFNGVFGEARRAFDSVASAGTAMPTSVAQLVSQLQTGGAFWTFARNLYLRVATQPADVQMVQRFYAECEPFRSLMIAIFAAQFDRCIRPAVVGPSLKAGRNDTFMAACLPYCNVFVTNDAGQLACYKEVASLARLEVDIRSYDEFRNQFSLAGSSRFESAGIQVR